MAFWRKRGAKRSDGDAAESPGTTRPSGAGDPAPRPAFAGAASAGLGGAATAAPDDPPTAFLKGDAQADRKSLHLLLDAIARVSASRDLESLLDYVVDSSLEATGAERGFLVLIDPTSGEQVVRVAREAGGRRIEDDVKYSTSVVARVLESGDPVRTTVQKNAEDLDLGNSIFDLKIRAVMCVPLVPRDEPGRERKQTVGGLPRGALYVDSKATTRAFKVEDLSLFHALAQHIAIALENAHLNLQSLEKARLERSLEIASEIQAGLLPKAAPIVPGFELFGWYRPADQTSGDFYDFVRTKSGGMAFVIGDVTGHGVGPALVTATAQASLRSYARVLGTPAEVVTMLNADLTERIDPGMFLTLFLAELGEGQIGDHRGGFVRTLNAGQTPPLLWRKATGTIESLNADGPALGMMGDYPYQAGPTIPMQAGDLLIAFTDGFVEARHPSYPDRLFGDDGIRAVLSDAGHRGLGAEATVAAIATAVLEFSDGVREDDLTIVAVRRTAP